MLMRTFQNRSANLKRGLGLLLVIFILYGTTVEAAHRHGVVVSAGSNNTSFDQTGSENRNPTTQPGCSDCLICQLHQNFSAALISIKTHSEPLVHRAHVRQLDPVSSRSIASSPQAGRAPPQAN